MNTKTTLRTAFLLLALGTFGLACSSDDDGENPPPPTGPSTTNVLRIGNAAGTSGGTAEIELSLESTEPLTGIQFDFNYNPAALTVTNAVTTTRSAGFEVFRADPDAGITRVVLADLNGTAEIATGDGAVVTLTVQIAAGPGTTGIAISDAIATDRSATPVTLGSSEATFTIH